MTLIAQCSTCRNYDATSNEAQDYGNFPDCSVFLKVSSFMMPNDQLQIVIETAESRIGRVVHAPQKVRIKQCAPKTRSGCLTCRKRRIKCDETRLHCERCIKARKRCHCRGTPNTMSTQCSLHTPLRPAYGDNEPERYLDIFLKISSCLAQIRTQAVIY